MRRVTCCSALVATLVGSGIVVDAATVVSSFRSKGAFASLSAQYDGCTWISLGVSRGGPADAPETYLNYNAYNGCTGEYSYGYGRIANSDFVVSGKRSRLKTDPASSAGMYTEGQTGRIELTWTADQSIRWSWDGRSESITPTQRVRSRGRYESSAASVTGTMLSLAVQTQSASVGKNRDTFIEVVR